MKNSIFIVTLVFILSSCGKKMNLSKEDSVKEFLSEHTIFLEGDLEFFDNGTFCLTPQSPNDPTQFYTGTYSLGECKNCDKDYASKEISIKFNNTGWVTDEHKIDGVRFSGFGTYLEGKITEDIDKDNKSGYKIEFKSSSSDGLVWDSNAGSEGGFVKSSKKFERSFKEKTDEQLEHTAPEIINKVSVEQSSKPTELNTNKNPVTELTEEFTLISGGCHEDGCTFVFKNGQQKEIISSSIPDNILEFDETEEGGTTVKDKYLNKKYSITYKMGTVHHEASDSDNEEMIISKIN